jgi:hypothetical protein
VGGDGNGQQKGKLAEMPDMQQQHTGSGTKKYNAGKFFPILSKV